MGTRSARRRRALNLVAAHRCSSAVQVARCQEARRRYLPVQLNTAHCLYSLHQLNTAETKLHRQLQDKKTFLWVANLKKTHEMQSDKDNSLIHYSLHSFQNKPKLRERIHSVYTSGETLCRDNWRLIGTPLIVIAWYSQKNGD